MGVNLELIKLKFFDFFPVEKVVVILNSRIKELALRLVPFWRARLIANSEFFDASWYREKYYKNSMFGIPPSFHYFAIGEKKGFHPGPKFNSTDYFRHNPDVAKSGMNALVHYLEFGRREGRPIGVLGWQEASLPSIFQEAKYGATLAIRFRSLEPMPILTSSSNVPKVVIVTDSVSSGSLFGGVGTALILGKLLSQRMARSLCIVTRTQPADPRTVLKTLEAQGIRNTGKIEFIFAPPGVRPCIPTNDRDLFITTSWWTTASTLRSVPARRVVYLLQEDERMFYPLGDDHLKCSEVLANSQLQFVVNSKLLFNHFASENNAVSRNGLYFEPAFPESNHRFEKRKNDKLLFAFYARPNNLRNLYYRGLEAIANSIDSKILDPELWEFAFFGKDLIATELPRGIKPLLRQNMSWDEYAHFIRKVDLGLSLMYTPHPSYPPLDIAASGGVCVTNQYQNKKSLLQYSGNIISSLLGTDNLVQSIRSGVELVANTRLREENYAKQKIVRNWDVSLKSVIQTISRGQ